MLSIAERRKYILDSLNRHGFVRVADMAAEMNVTKATVRKDMEFLESRNLLYRTHGSASPVNPLVQDVSVHVKSAVNSEIKQKIAVEAAGLICPDDSVFIASGSTVYAFAERIRPVGHLNVVTPSLRVAMLMNESEETTVTVLGGVLYKKSLSVRGEYAAQGFENVICSKLFFGADGIDSNFGITCATAEEATLTQKMMRASAKSVVLADSSKFGRFRPDMFDGADRLHRYRRRYFGAVPQADRGGRSRSDRRETLRDLPATERAYGCRGK